jgi:hypothetical protein
MRSRAIVKKTARLAKLSLYRPNATDSTTRETPSGTAGIEVKSEINEVLESSIEIPATPSSTTTIPATRTLLERK